VVDEQAEHGIAQRRHRLGLLPRARLAGILAQRDIPRPMQPILDVSMGADNAPAQAALHKGEHVLHYLQAVWLC
jgi:hypothetical protein